MTKLKKQKRAKVKTVAAKKTKATMPESKKTVNKLSEVDNKFKVTAQDLTEAVERAGKPAQQTDGKDWGRQANILVSQKKTLDEIWGVKYSLYKTSDPEEYLARLRKMTKLDLQRECIRVGRQPHDDREKMTKFLYEDCRKSITAAKTSSLQPQVIKIGKSARDILQKGGQLLA